MPYIIHKTSKNYLLQNFHLFQMIKKSIAIIIWCLVTRECVKIFIWHISFYTFITQYYLFIWHISFYAFPTQYYLFISHISFYTFLTQYYFSKNLQSINLANYFISNLLNSSLRAWFNSLFKDVEYSFFTNQTLDS